MQKRLKYSLMGSLKVGDTVIAPGKDTKYSTAKILSIQEQGETPVYKVTLSDNTTYRTHLKHLTSVCFRTKDNKDVWDTISTQYMMDHLNEYKFEVLAGLDNITTNHIFDLLQEHEYEPDDVIIKREPKGVYIKSIEEDGVEQTRCISLNDPLGLYFTDNEIITHNSTLTCLMLLYIACLYGLMRDPWAFFGKAKTTVFGYALCAVTQTKAQETYVDQIKQLIMDADFWMQCRTADEMIAEDKQLMNSDTVEYLPWTTAVKSAQPLGAKIMLPDGSWTTMGELKIGDTIASPTYGTATVEAFPYEGECECYEIELEDGRKTRCSIDHKWKVAWKKVDYTDAWDWHIVNTRFLLEHPELNFEIFDN